MSDSALLRNSSLFIAYMGCLGWGSAYFYGWGTSFYYGFPWWVVGAGVDDVARSLFYAVTVIVVFLIDRNLNPQKTKKAPQNGCFFNTPCAPYERKRLLNRMTLIDTGYEWRFFAPFPVKWTQLPLCGSQPHTCCRASRSCIRTSSASR